MISLTILSLILSLLIGAALGLWFTVHVLVLAIMLALVVVAGAGVAAEARLWWIALDIFVVTTCLQLGYIAASVLEARTAFRETQRLGYSLDNPPPGDEHVDDGEEKLSGRSHEREAHRRIGEAKNNDHQAGVSLLDRV